MDMFMISKNDIKVELPEFLTRPLEEFKDEATAIDNDKYIWHSVKTRYYTCSVCGRDIERGWICSGKNIGVCDVHQDLSQLYHYKWHSIVG